MVIHPDYIGYNDGKYTNDITLVRSDKPFHFNSYVRLASNRAQVFAPCHPASSLRPICYGDLMEDFDPGNVSLCVVSGFGSYIANTGSSTSSVLRYEKVPLWTDHECNTSELLSPAVHGCACGNFIFARFSNRRRIF